MLFEAKGRSDALLAGTHPVPSASRSRGHRRQPVTESTDGGSGPAPKQNGEEDLIARATRMLLDNTPLGEMTPPLFYHHGSEELNMTVRDLLRLLEHDPDV
jgi:hypothetical protein